MTRIAVEPGSVGTPERREPNPITPVEHEGLCERLLRIESSNPYAAEGQMTTNWHRNPDGPEAATTIRTQAGEIDRLTTALAKANGGFEEYERRFYLEQDAREAQAAELERLRGALRYGRSGAIKEIETVRALGMIVFADFLADFISRADYALSPSDPQVIETLAERMFTNDRRRKRVAPDWIGMVAQVKDEWRAKAARALSDTPPEPTEGAK